MTKEVAEACAAFPMKGGDGRYSYAKNSTYQKKYVDDAKELIIEGIVNHLDVKQIKSSFPSICIADLGCSVGPNTFFAVENIIEGIQHKSKLQDLSPPEFQVFFSDHVSNDFNKLFASLPSDKQYLASGVPGSFYNRLFPKASLHFVHSSTSIHWLSKVPKELNDVNSPTYNKGRIHHGDAPKEVEQAYLAQFVKDMDSFLSARAEELVSGGLMALMIPTKALEAHTFPHGFDILGSCLMEMAKKGRFSEAEVDSFNIPMYIPSVEEFEGAIKSNEYFTIESLELLGDPSKKTNKQLDAETMKKLNRTVLDSLIGGHFGAEIMDELVDPYTEKLIEIYKSESRFDRSLFVLLKRI
ncbi:hypothetical protein AQUCO_11000052v1 [Aquilegia coerulea]|uniref:Uncharacterized protein n=1 Tax=Aquilegia coerulea TaxID=218851 RepID=A0A2G5C2Z0_AQUCA|nr:hypothetical protein AQUCO_11000052v1 [Aquilegia coerulea]